jgi:hypothetical protein
VLEPHPVICDCEDCMNRGGGVRLDRLKPRPPAPDDGALAKVQAKLQGIVAKMRARAAYARAAKATKFEIKSAQNARNYQRRKLRGAGG